KIRIYEYAKDLKLKSKDIIDELKKMDVEVTSHMQTLEDDQIKALDKVYKPEKSDASENKQQGQNQQKPSKNKTNANKKNKNKKKKKKKKKKENKQKKQQK